MDETMHRGRTTSKAGQRTALDCRDFPGSDCTLRLEGTEDEVLKAGVEHAISSHGYKNTPELKEQLRTMLVASP